MQQAGKRLFLHISPITTSSNLTTDKHNPPIINFQASYQHSTKQPYSITAMEVPVNLLGTSSSSKYTQQNFSSNKNDIPVTNSTLGGPETVKNHLLESGAKHMQSFDPPKRICAHLHAFHAYASDTSRISGSHHYCAHLNDEVRQCLLYDSSEPGARLIGVEYMITPRIYETLDPEERRLWHSHVFEVKSGLLVMPGPTGVPDMVWEAAETREMGQVVGLYGKVFQLWQTDRGDLVPLGKPELMCKRSLFISLYLGLILGTEN
jgi:hypothetical protein